MVSDCCFSFSQVACGLRDHFATTVSYLLPICALSMGEMLADGTLRNHFVTTTLFLGVSSRFSVFFHEYLPCSYLFFGWRFGSYRTTLYDLFPEHYSCVISFGYLATHARYRSHHFRSHNSKILNA